MKLTSWKTNYRGKLRHPSGLIGCNGSRLGDFLRNFLPALLDLLPLLNGKLCQECLPRDESFWKLTDAFRTHFLLTSDSVVISNTLQSATAGAKNARGVSLAPLMNP